MCTNPTKIPVIVWSKIEKVEPGKGIGHAGMSTVVYEEMFLIH